MAGFRKLGHSDMEVYLGSALGEEAIKTAFADDFISTTQSEIIANPFKYFYDENNKQIIITTPLPAATFNDLLPELDRYFKSKGYEDCHLLAGLTGQGATEQHIITAYCSPDRSIIKFFDSKASNPVRFFDNFSRIKFFPTLLTLLRSIRPKPTNSIPMGEVDAEFIGLGTQSFFDGDSCGYHTGGNILTCSELLIDKQTPNRTNLLEKTHNPVREVQATLNKHYKNDPISTGMTPFIRQAWLETFMPLANDAEREGARFSQYFMKWPEKTRERVIYFLTLGFLIHPLINTLKIPTEFVLLTASQTANFVKHQLMGWAPTNVFSQFLRSSFMLASYGVQGLFKAAYYGVRLVTSPMTSFKDAYKTHPVLGVLSAIGSMAAYGAIALFAVPAVVGLLPVAMPAVVSALAFPVNYLLAYAGVSLAASAAAAATILVSTGLIYSLRNAVSMGLKKLFGSEPVRVKKTQFADDFVDLSEEDTSLVGDNDDDIGNCPKAFRQLGPTDDSDSDDFCLVDEQHYPPVLQKDKEQEEVGNISSFTDTKTGEYSSQ